MPPRKRKYKKPDPALDAPTDRSGSDSDSDAAGERPRQRQRGTAAADKGLISTFFAGQRAGSNRSVADLRLGAGDEGSLRALTAALPERFPTEKAALRARLEAQFGRWWAEWRAGHSLLLYGYGCKRGVLRKLAATCTGDGACLEVNGMQPGVTPRQILARVAALAKLVKPQHLRTASVEELLAAIAEEGPHRRVYVAVHNIDGPGLRDPAGQRLLSQMAALPNVHLAASIDHVNAPLLWDLQTKDRFAWLWHQATTFRPYLEEVAAAAMPSLLIGKKEACTQQSALVVLSSLSHTAREVFRIVADAQLDPSGGGGINFQRLFSCCRERFLVSNEMLLKAFLTEFRDHDLLVSKRDQEGGGDVLCVPLDAESLQQVLQGMEGGN